MIGLRAWATLSKGVRIYPNVNGLLLSPAGKCRRGEGTKITMKIAQGTMLNVFSGKQTPESLCDELIDNGDTLLYVEELSMLLTKQDFQRPIIAVLTKLLLHGDGVVQLRTRKQGKKEIPYVNLSALFTSAPEWFMTTIPEEAFGGGLMSRFIVCCLDDREIYNIDIQSDDEQSREVITALTRDLSKCYGVLEGHIKGTDEAQEWVEAWYLENEQYDVTDTRLAPHRNRKPANLLRIAMILGAAALDPVLTAERLEQALAILNYFEPTLVKLYGITEETVSTMDRGEKRIMHKLSAINGAELTHRDLARACSIYFRGGTREMRHCLEGMVEKGLVNAEYKGGIRSWPPASWHLNVKKL
jgi:hypothetical protein